MYEAMGLFPDKMFAPQGWICPKCGRVYSPTTPMCFYCGDETSTTQYTTTSVTISTEDESKERADNE